MQYHLSKNEKQYGPYSSDQIASYIKQGKIQPNDLVFFEGATAWIPVSSVREFYHILQQPKKEFQSTTSDLNSAKPNTQHKIKGRKKIVKIVTTVSLIIVAFTICLKLSEPSHSNKSSTNIKQKSWAYKLAMLNAGGTISGDDITVKRFKHLIENMVQLFPEENEEGIADGIVLTKNLLEKKGISESILNIAESLNKVFITNKGNITYNELCASYMTVRVKGQSSREAVLGLQSMFNALGAR